MCFATAALIAGGLGAATGALGQVEGGIAQEHAAQYQAAVSRNNELTAGRNAEYASAAGQVRASELGMRNAQTAGRIKSSQAAGNIDVNSGSAVDVQTGQRQAGQLDVLTEENNALLQAYGYKTQATNFAAQAGLEEAQASQAPIGADIGAVGSLAEQASSLGFKWLPFMGGS